MNIQASKVRWEIEEVNHITVLEHLGTLIT